MTAYIDFPLASLVDKENSEIVDKLLESDRLSGFTQVSQNQIDAWHAQLDMLRHIACAVREEEGETARPHLVLEYRIPRRETRADAIILLDKTIVLIEFKVGSLAATSSDVAQILDYALDIAYYHAESRDRRLAPVLCATGMKGRKSGPSSDVPPIAPLTFCGSEALREVLAGLRETDRQAPGPRIVPSQWVRSRYQPIPGVIEAAVQLFRAHEVEDIKSTLAGDERIAATVAYIDRLVAEARTEGRKTLCLLTGVPGAGKTLAGLQVAHLEETKHWDWRATFITGNGPLLKVLQAALTRDYRDRQGMAAAQASAHAKALLHNVHSYLEEAMRSASPPNERVVVFDEAQRAWDAEKMQRMANRPRSARAAESARNNVAAEQSEPWQIMKALDRHEGGAMVVALCGHGQEIHDGEAGISEWVAARDRGFTGWRVVCSPIAAEFAGIDVTHVNTVVSSELHLGVPVRAHRAERHAQWVDAVLSGRPDDARQSVDVGALPIFLTRDIEKARDWLERTTLGSRRCGLLACSNGTRLRPYGVEVSAGFRKGVDYPSWFTEHRGNLRSSFALEVAATEFECQGLELDRVALCWSWDMQIIDGRPTPRVLRGSKWFLVKNEREQGYARNKYRVLLTRAREAIVIWVPKGRSTDVTRNPAEADAIAAYLKLCGVQELLE